MELVNKYKTEKQLKAFLYKYKAQRVLEFMTICVCLIISFLYVSSVPLDPLTRLNWHMTIALFFGIAVFIHAALRFENISYFSTALVTGGNCLKISTWMTHYPVAKTYIEQLNKERAVTQYDYLALAIWLDNYEEGLVHEEERNACKRIQGIV